MIFSPRNTRKDTKMKNLPNPPYDVLVLCTGNAARSVLVEYILRAKGKGRFTVFSAGGEAERADSAVSRS